MSVHRAQVEDAGKSPSIHWTVRPTQKSVEVLEFPLIDQPLAFKIPQRMEFSINTLITYRLKQSCVSSALACCLSSVRSGGT